MKTSLFILAILCTIFFQSCDEDTPEFPCVEGVLLGPVCPFGAGYLGYIVFVRDSVPGAISYFDSSLGEGFRIAVLSLPQPYQDQSGVEFYFTARAATPDEIGPSSPRTANCDQPPLFVIREIKKDCASPSSD